jgi:pilus assembly protein FimV
MVRKLMLAAAGSLAFCSTAFGLGLGDLQLKSSLNQTFNASIDLRDVDGLNPDEVLVRLASADDFNRAGMERSAYLLDFRFSVQIGPDGRGQIRVTSVRPLTEPFVEFLVSVAWPTGRMQRQYTVLLDPPRNEVLRPSEVTAPSSSSRRPPSPPRDRDIAADAPRRPEAGARAPGFDGSEYGPTTSRDTAWRVAEQVRPSNEVTTRQTLIALLRLNPQAFVGENVNRLKAGQTLRTPTVEQAQQASDAEARREIAQQTRAWRGERAPRPAPADTGTPVTSTAAAAPAPAPAPPKDEVRIVAPPAAAGARPAPGPDAELAGSEEERDRLSRELNQAGTSISALQQQTAALNNQIAARDQQIAELKRQMEEVKAAQSGAAPAGTGGGPLDTWLGKGLLLGFAAALIAALALLNLWDKARKRAAQAERDKAATDERMERTVRMERERTGNTQRGGIIAPAAAAVAAPAAARALPARPAMSEPSLDLTSDGLSRTAEVSDFDKTVILADPGAEARRGAGAAQPAVTETLASDVVSEADIYIAYGRFPQAISFLQSALEKEPNRNDARLKLMEAYAETRDAAGFQMEAQQLLSRSPTEADLRRARQLQARLPGVVAIPSEPLADQDADFDKTIIDASMADQALQETLNSASVELDLDLDRTDLLSDIDAPKPLDLDLSADLPGDSGKLDFDLTLDGLDPTPMDDRGDDLGGDLGLQFRDDDFDPERTASLAPSSDDDTGFDLTLDGRGPAVAPAKRVAAPLPDDDIGLSLTLDSADEIAPALRNDDIAGLDTIEGAPVDDDLEDFLAGDTDEARTKLDLARAYIDMGDEDGARDILNEVLAEGSDGQKQEARELIARLS